MSLTKLDLNNQIVMMRHNVKRAKVQTLNKLSRRIKTMKKKSTPDDQKTRLETKIQKLVEEIFAMKKLKEDEISAFSLVNTKTSSEIFSKETSGPKVKALVRLSEHKSVSPVVELFRKKYPEWKENLPKLLIALKSGVKLKSNKSRPLPPEKVKKDSKEGQKDDRFVLGKEHKIDLPEGLDTEEGNSGGSSSDEAGSEERGCSADDSPAEELKGRFVLLKPRNSNERNSFEEESDIENEDDGQSENEVDGQSENEDDGQSENEDDRQSENEDNGQSENEEFEGESNREIDRGVKCGVAEKNVHRNSGTESASERNNFYESSDDECLEDIKTEPSVSGFSTEEREPKPPSNVDPFFMTNDDGEYLTCAPIEEGDNEFDTRNNGGSFADRFKPRDPFFGADFNSRIDSGYSAAGRRRGDSRFQRGAKSNRFQRGSNKRSFQGERKSFDRPPRKYEKRDGFRDKKSNSKMFNVDVKKSGNSLEKLHPSWQAKKKLSTIAPFSGKKITFD